LHPGAAIVPALLTGSALARLQKCYRCCWCRGLLAQYGPQRLLVVAEAQDTGVSKAAQQQFSLVGARSTCSQAKAAWAAECKA